jgi:hypothetical protein
MYNGDFSQFPQQLYDPETQQPLPGNIIPERLRDPSRQEVLRTHPDGSKFRRPLRVVFRQSRKDNELLGKVDYNLGSAQSFMVSYFRTFGDQQIAIPLATEHSRSGVRR